MNIKNLIECVKFFKQEPLRLEMGTWLNTRDIPINDPHEPPCGTVGCLVGSAIYLEMKKQKVDRWDVMLGVDNETFGQRYFEISYAQANKLFYTENWPTPFAQIYYELESDFKRCRHPHVIPYIKKKMVEVLELRIQRFIDDSYEVVDNATNETMFTGFKHECSENSFPNSVIMSSREANTARVIHKLNQNEPTPN